MKRPWTPSWKDPLTGETERSGSEHTAWSKLGDYREEMAELLIELSKMRIGGYVYWEEQIELINQAKKLLKEIGYDPKMDTDPAN